MSVKKLTLFAAWMVYASIRMEVMIASVPRVKPAIRGTAVVKVKCSSNVFYFQVYVSYSKKKTQGFFRCNKRRVLRILAELQYGWRQIYISRIERECSP